MASGDEWGSSDLRNSSDSDESMSMPSVVSEVSIRSNANEVSTSPPVSKIKKRRRKKRKSHVLLGRTTCTECHKSLACHAVGAHMRRIHPQSDDKLYRCERYLCQERFLTLTDRHRHYIAIHGYEPESRAVPVDKFTKLAAQRLYSPPAFIVTETRHCHRCKERCENRTAYLRDRKECHKLKRVGGRNIAGSGSPDAECSSVAETDPVSQVVDGECNTGAETGPGKRRRTDFEHRRWELWAAEGHLEPPPWMLQRARGSVRGELNRPQASTVSNANNARSTSSVQAFIADLRNDPVLGIYAHAAEFGAKSPFSQLASNDGFATSSSAVAASAVKRLYD